MSIKAILTERFQAAMHKAGMPADCAPHIGVSKNSQFGDYQANGAMSAAKKMSRKPRDLAEDIKAHVKIEDIAHQCDIAGPGFINIHLRPEWLAQHLTEHPPYQPVDTVDKQTVVIDYSSPNLAKEMHVGHLRSTIIGDAVVRVLEHLNHHVIRQNHVGDWGTQFGMLVAELEDQLQKGDNAELALKDLEGFYQSAKKHFDEDDDFAERARENVVKLQQGDPEVNAHWQAFRSISLTHCQSLYDALNVSLTPENVRGESFYNHDLPVLVAELKQQGLAVEDQGALVVFLQELADKKGKPSPVIVQKSGGGYLYSTSDLAALRYRYGTLNAHRIMVFSDARQSLHMQQVYTLAKKADFVPQDLRLEHLAFGTMMGKDGKPFKTRTGGTVKLADLLEEACERAKALVTSNNRELSSEEIEVVAHKVGIGAVKYADLSKTRTLDYIFDWDDMLRLDGNTGPYMQYAYARTCSIFRKAQLTPESTKANTLLLEKEPEKALSLKLLQWDEAIALVADEAMPHVLCTYLYELASLYMRFYEACPILKEGIEPQTKASRLALCYHTGQTIKLGLDLLGIEVMERM